MFKRSEVCDKLRISHVLSYRHFPATKSGLINSDDVVELLNGARANGQPYVSEIPSDICDIYELAARLDCGLSARKISEMSVRNKSKVPPHYRFSARTRRFRVSTFQQWLNEKN